MGEYQCVECPGYDGRDYWFRSSKETPLCPKCKGEPCIVSFQRPKTTYEQQVQAILDKIRDGGKTDG